MPVNSLCQFQKRKEKQALPTGGNTRGKELPTYSGTYVFCQFFPQAEYDELINKSKKDEKLHT